MIDADSDDVDGIIKLMMSACCDADIIVEALSTHPAARSGGGAHARFSVVKEDLAQAAQKMQTICARPRAQRDVEAARAAYCEIVYAAEAAVSLWLEVSRSDSSAK